MTRVLTREEGVFALMSANKNLIETNLVATDLSVVARLLTNDAEWAE